MQGHGTRRRGRHSAAWRGAGPRPLSIGRLQRLLARAEILERDVHGIKVARLPSGTILKLFRRKRLLSSAAWRPYALRFVRNAQALNALAVPTVGVRAYWHCPQAQRHVVAYRPLEGEVLRDRLGDGKAVDWPALARFAARLHDRGVYFRSLHSGNIVCVPNGGFGLIDIADLQVLRGPLGTRRRIRNLRPLLRDPALSALRQPELFGDLIDAYCRSANAHPRQEARLRRLAWRQWARCTDQGSGASASGSPSLTGNR